MSWITAIWSATAAICLTLAGVHFLVWVKSRASWANLLFSIAATSAAVCAGFELALMHAQTAAQFGEVLRWFHVPIALMAWLVFLITGGQTPLAEGCYTAAIWFMTTGASSYSV